MARLLQEVLTALHTGLRCAGVADLHLGLRRDLPAPKLPALDLAVQAPKHVAGAFTVGFRQQNTELVAPQAKQMVDRADAGLQPAADFRHRVVCGAILARGRNCR